MPTDRMITVVPLADLLDQVVHALITAALRQPRGLAVFAGHVGSGKMTSAFGAADEQGAAGRRVLLASETLEEFAELAIPSGVPWSFAAAGAGATKAQWSTALAAASQAADVIVVPALVPANAAAVFEAASGATVVTCIDTPLVGIDVIYSLLQLGADPQRLVDTLSLISSQFLIRRLCEACRKPASFTPSAAQELMPGIAESADAWIEGGCPACEGTGTQGWTAVHEIIVVDDASRAAVAAAAAAWQGPVLPSTHYCSMQETARRLLRDGAIGIGTYRNEITRNPVLRVTNQLESERAAMRTTRRVFRRFVDEAVIRDVMADDGAALHARRADATCLFCDVRGFTAYAERHDAGEVFTVLNRIIDEVIAIVLRHGGMVDKIIGDSVMALFGLPEPAADHAQAATACALAIQRRMSELAQADGAWARLRVGVGVNSGELAAGCLGNEHRIEYTVLGDVVNTAARLEAMAAPGQVLVGGGTYERLAGAYEARDLGRLALRGKAEPVRVFEVLSRIEAPMAAASSVPR